ncbi:hypothetical protein ACIBEJ_47235 [Nonomuraea sp. NPDC050790]|uniref:hypothetical protein n=1 Tax=Nonomuraea sp. NPDC050790 TaxID=3364371 RepID=UPI00378EAFAF
MRRHRFGGIAAPIALGYLAAITVLAAIALADPRNDLLWLVVTRGSSSFSNFAFGIPWGLAIAAILVGALQSWALWEVLRGRVRGAPTDLGRQVGLLRLALYLTAGIGLTDLAAAPLIGMWDTTWYWSVSEIVSGVLQMALAWLFFLVLRATAARPLRLFSLVAGTIAGLVTIGYGVADLLDLEPATRVLTLAGSYGLVWAAWAVSILVAQAKDPRWSAATVRIGIIAQVVSLLQPRGFSFFIGGFGHEVPYVLMTFSLLSAVGVFGLVWQARSAHELAGPFPERLTAPPPERPAAGRWPLPVVAIVLPLVPAAVNLAQGGHRWSGSGSATEQFLRSTDHHAEIWVAIDVFVGVGGPALLVLAAVLRRTRRAVRLTVVTLSVAAAVGVVHALTTTAAFSPLWYSAALLAAALLLQVPHPFAPGARTRRAVLPAAAATLVTLGFVVRMKEPQMTDHGVLEAYEPTATGADTGGDDLLDRAQKDGLVASLPGRLMVLSQPDFGLCVTVETYRRRPPVETEGWDRVIEVGYESPTGEIVLRDDMFGTELPDLALDGRAGYYRIRVHYDLFKTGGELKGQRMLIMAYPGKLKNRPSRR